MNKLLAIILFATCSLFLSACCQLGSGNYDNCPFCTISGSSIQKIVVSGDSHLSEVIDRVFREMGTGCARGLDFVIQLPDDGMDPIVEAFSAEDCKAKDVLRLICDTCDYYYVINPGGVVYFFPRSSGSELINLCRPVWGSEEDENGQQP